jgi:hypothetical protein
VRRQRMTRERTDPLRTSAMEKFSSGTRTAAPGRTLPVGGGSKPTRFLPLKQYTIPSAHGRYGLMAAVPRSLIPSVKLYFSWTSLR